MKIDGWHIDGYGVHHDLTETDLPDGLTVIDGPNEAGKTTLQHFLIGMLFGFTAKNRADHHAPVRGGTYGGRLFVTDDEGTRYVLHRGGRGTRLRITGPDGPVPDPEAMLRDLLGGTTKDLYQGLFAVHSDELDELRALTDDQVRDRVFSAGIVGAGRTARAALSQLAGERDELWKPGGRSADKYLLKRLKADLTNARSQLADARRDATGLAGLVHRIGVLEADRDHVKARRSELEERRSLLFVVSNQWPTWAEAAEARGELDQLGRVAPVPADAGVVLDQLLTNRDALASQVADDADELAATTEALEALDPPGPVLAHTDAIAELAATLRLAEERAAALPNLAAEALRVQGDLQSTLAFIGPDADETWLAELPFDADAAATLRSVAGTVHDARQHLAHVRAANERATATHDDELAAHAEREAVLAERTAHPVDRARQAVEDAAALLALLDRRDTVTHRLATSQRPMPAAPASEMPSYLVPALAAAGASGVAGGAVVAATGAPIAGGIAVLLGAALAVLAFLARRSLATDADISGDIATDTDAARDLAQELVELDRSIAPLLTAFKLDARPSVTEASNLRVRADQLAADAERLDRDRADAAQHRRTLDERGQRLAERGRTEEAEANATLHDAIGTWHAWLTDHRLPTTLDADGAADLLDAIDRARGLQYAATAARTTFEDAEAAHKAYATAVLDLIATTGLTTTADPTHRPLAAIAELEAARHRAHATQQAIEHAEIARRAAARQHAKATARLDEATTALEVHLAKLDVTTVDDAREHIERADLAASLTRQITQADRDLKHSIGPDPERLAAAQALLTRADPVRWQRELDEFDKQLLAVDAEIDDATTELAHLVRERDDLERSADVPSAELHVADLEAQLVEAVTRWAALATAHRMVEDTLARYQRERQPDVVKRAAAHFAQVTDGRYQRLEVRGQEIVAIDQAEREVHAHQLSKGAAQQLYLCMRFALAESYARTTRLPLLLDDVTVYSDDRRMPRLAELIAAVTADHQVLVFTSHAATIAQLRSADPDARHIALHRSGATTTTARAIGLAVS